ncbi:1-phosphofructokinase [Eubacterium limosum]|uniref:1-phosphofructokinase n=1 Tax=Eubacterium limosum TaxID=1736 RepID=UPI0010629AE5|nr:1-phosphofructokinase [Eubacterium limosum]
MIYTVTFNPSLDYIVKVDDFKTGQVNRTASERLFPGGKGINVSIVLKNLGFDNVALGFIAGFTGREIEKRVRDFGCSSDFIEIDNGLSRINVKLKSQEESEINGRGPQISEEAFEKLFAQLDRLKPGDVLALAGSIPSSMPSDTYERIMARLENRGIDIVVDATKDLLKKVLKYHPFLIKPNNHELGDMFGVTLKNDDEIILYGKKLQEMGARNVLVSMAGDGAIFLNEDGSVHKSAAPSGEVKNSVGAGDSMVAGFLAGYLESGDLAAAFKMGVATGSASAFSEELATRQEVADLLNKI